MDRILIVEDSPTQAERLGAILEHSGYEAVIAGDGHAALEQLSRESFALIISDIVMPGMSGYELCFHLKEQAKLRDVPVILLTTRKDPMDIVQGLECGADSFYTKPYDPPRLIKRIEQILYNRELRAQGKLKFGVEISFFGKVITINSDKAQILDLLISTFEDAIQTNRELEKSREELAEAKRKIEQYVELLEQRVSTSEEKYRAIVEGVAEGLITIDEKGIVDSVNQAAQAMFGYAAAELVGKHVALVVPDRDKCSSDDGLPDCIQNGIGKRGDRELEAVRKDGSVFPMSLMVSEMNLGGQRNFIAVTRDLTLQRDIERQLRQAQKMEAIGQLTGGIAHDFNNLLTVILGNAEEVNQQLPDESPLKELVQMIGAAAGKGGDLSQRLLTFARQQALAPVAVNLNTLVEGMHELISRTLGDQVKVRLVGADDLWDVLIDAGQIENALLNLCINARDAMPDGGEITIETANVVIDEDYVAQNIDARTGDFVMLSVSDTGTGIRPEHLSRIFEPFFTTKGIGRGTGFGLAMVYGFIRQSGGHVHVYSEADRGTIIRLYMPRMLDERVAVAPPPKPDQAPTGGTETILLVEDDEMVRKFAQAQLSALGYEVMVSSDGQEALSTLRGSVHVDLLFTDVVMPGGLTGPQVAEAARKLRPTLKVLLTSGYNEDDFINTGRFDLNIQLLSKPYRRVELARAVRTALDSG